MAFYYGLATKLPDSAFPGGRLWRAIRHKSLLGFGVRTGQWINVQSHVFIGDGRSLEIGHGSGIGTGSRIYGATIGEGVMIGPSVTILKDNHTIGNDGRVSAGMTTAAVPVIGDGAWIGEKAIILPGRNVGEGAVVGAGAVVTRDVQPGTVVGGNPATVLRASTAVAPRPTV